MFVFIHEKLKFMEMHFFSLVSCSYGDKEIIFLTNKSYPMCHIVLYLSVLSLYVTYLFGLYFKFYIIISK